MPQSDKRKIVITGIGILSPNAIGKDAFWQALKDGRSGIKPITVFDPSLFKTKLAGEISDFSPETILGDKYIKGLDRSTNFLCSATKLALDDARLEVSQEIANRIGMVTATTISVVWNIGEFSKEIVQDGPEYVNPAIFPGTTINAPSSQASIRFGIKGFNATVSTGFTAGLDALRYAVDFLQAGRADVILVAGVESLTFQGFAGFYKMDFLAGIKGEEISCPFDKRRNGIILGEGSGVIVLEDQKRAQDRGAKIYAAIESVENTFDTFRSGKYNPHAKGLKNSIMRALDRAELNRDDIDYISASANSVPLQDKLETEAIKEIFQLYAQHIPISSIKSMLGEALSVAGIFQLIASVGSMQNNFVPPTINYKVKDEECGLDYCVDGARQMQPDYILINSFGPGGSNAAAVMSRYAR